MTEVNIPLLRKEVEWVEEQDKLPYTVREWNQRVYVEPLFDTSLNNANRKRQELGMANHCGTAYCVAGHIGAQLDKRFARDSSIVVTKDDPLVQYLGEEYITALNREGTVLVHVEHVATKALGLSGYDASRMFSGSNSAEDIRRIAEEVAGEKL